jgi:hypothetical protein
MFRKRAEGGGGRKTTITRNLHGQTVVWNAANSGSCPKAAIHIDRGLLPASWGI